MAARFHGESLSQQLNDSNDSWSNFLDIIDDQESQTQKPPNINSSIPTFCNVETSTDEKYFELINKLEANASTITEEKIVNANGKGFKPLTVQRLVKLKKPMYDKSTSTESLKKVKYSFIVIVIHYHLVGMAGV